MGDALALRLAGVGFAFVPGAQMRAQLEAVGPLMDWNRFSDSWNDLPLARFLVHSG